VYFAFDDSTIGAAASVVEYVVRASS